MRYGLRGAAARLPGQVLDGLPGARQHGARAAAGSHGRGQGKLGLAERGHVTTVLTSDWSRVRQRGGPPRAEEELRARALRQERQLQIPRRQQVDI